MGTAIVSIDPIHKWQLAALQLLFHKERQRDVLDSEKGNLYSYISTNLHRSFKHFFMHQKQADKGKWCIYYLQPENVY